ncbi:hypothetical protein EDB51_117109 [Vibrio crassostreae]|uniref:hypothetical protein n=1 Tax=Vibrio crassostreae TaxID=246167 RepID=UPI0010446B38|nr:hypothetical protein [Vibrio crassostreae]TCN95792.1 hypothetical protein EDB51_117109 [Vibrio crassostreae]CAK2756708.1 hypothetical protein VCRA2127O15_170103 [Vibrio crassostreae]CAK3360760.1 hypothetical protein VCRA2123O13_180033 [Vibrio crassostreae]CAK3759478.1 hypothetical protein VCRA2120O6_180035 [Vibrio crassostreae]
MYNAEQFEDKKELTTYAVDKYGLKLDGRSSIEDLLDSLNEAANSNQGDAGQETPDLPETPPVPDLPETPPTPEPEVKPKPRKVVYRNDVVGNALRHLRSRR